MLKQKFGHASRPGWLEKVTFVSAADVVQTKKRKKGRRGDKQRHTFSVVPFSGQGDVVSLSNQWPALSTGEHGDALSRVEVMRISVILPLAPEKFHGAAAAAMHTE